MKKEKGAVGLLVLVAIVILALVLLLSKQSSSPVVQQQGTTVVSSIDSDLNDLNSTDIDSGIDDLLTQNDQDASNF